jgi:transposase
MSLKTRRSIGVQAKVAMAALAGDKTLAQLTQEFEVHSPKPVSDHDLDVMRRLDELYLIHPFTGADVGRSIA